MIVTFSICCALIVLTTIKMPETFNITTPEIIKELEVNENSYFQ
jgi:hypothetical protein